jgi:hypothetical protein
MKPFMGKKHPHLSCGNRHAIRSSKKDRALHTVRVWHIYVSSLAIFCLQLVGYMVGVLAIVPQRCHLLDVIAEEVCPDFTAAMARACKEGPWVHQSNCFVLCMQDSQLPNAKAHTDIHVQARC